MRTKYKFVNVIYKKPIKYFLFLVNTAQIKKLNYNELQKILIIRKQ